MPGSIPPHVVIDDFLTADQLTQLDSLAASHANAFYSVAVGEHDLGSKSPVSRSHWQAAGGLGPCEDWFTAALTARLGDLFAGTGVPRFEIARFEYELNAHFDGNFIDPHIDLKSGDAATGRTTDRLLSMVFYFSRPGQPFTGGELMLYPFSGTSQALAIAPLRNRLVAFPSMAVHEVAKVDARDDGIANARLSINCWLSRARPDAR